MNSQGQAAFEYLMTYGWALIVIAIVVGFLIFTVNNPQQTEYWQEEWQCTKEIEISRTKILVEENKETAYKERESAEKKENTKCLEWTKDDGYNWCSMWTYDQIEYECVEQTFTKCLVRNGNRQCEQEE